MAKRLTGINTYYVFEDGYAMWVAGRLTASERKAEIRKHGQIVRMVAR